MNKYIFLDIDGPLNTGRDDYRDPKYGDHFDSEAVENLREIVEATGASIVISSSWRHMGIKRMHEIWRDWNLPGKIAGCTPGSLGDDNAFNTRGEEIQAWLDENAKGPKSYVIIDDLGFDHFLENQYLRLIQVDPNCGITTDDALHAIKILNEEVSESYLFPREGVVPIEMEDNHRDYLLSEILLSYGYKLIGLTISFELLMRGCDVYQPCLFTGICNESLKEKYAHSTFYPLKLVHDKGNISDYSQFDDVRLRYWFDKSGAVSNILWVALYKDGKILYSLA